EYRHLVASGLMGVFKKIWPDVWSARMEYILNNAILSLLEYPNATLLGVNRMLSDPDFRKKVVDKVSDPVVKSFWLQEFAKYTQRYETEATAAIQNKVGQFISNPLVRNIIGQVRANIDMRKVMDEGKILIANISKGRIGEDNSRLLGALVITKLQLAAMSRVDTPEEKRRDFNLYVDEFQNFATDAFVTILSEARKYRLALTLGNQYIGQLEEMTAGGRSTNVRDAVFGNVGTIVCFRIGAEDAEFLEREFTPEFLATDLVNLGKYNIYLKLMVDGVASRPFSAQTLPPLPTPEDSSEKKIIAVSRERYATPRQSVEEKISKWAGVIATPTASAVSPAGSGSASVLYDAQCANCKKWTKVIFPPDGTRPVYCKSCLKKVETKREEVKETRMPSPSPPPPPVPVRTAAPISLPKISLEEAKERGAVSFSLKNKPPTDSQSSVATTTPVQDQSSRPKHKEVNIDELKEALKSALEQGKKDENT
ncbi:MAG: TraM recognition domain-containing protein, partial [Candidatus Wildermuthbacteria bacterium]|nr:TraM recognition domain-containing protein [Candidatus Wildermuthbacteria bacterium]